MGENGGLNGAPREAANGVSAAPRGGVVESGSIQAEIVRSRTARANLGDISADELYKETQKFLIDNDVSLSDFEQIMNEYDLSMDLSGIDIPAGFKFTQRDIVELSNKIENNLKPSQIQALENGGILKIFEKLGAKLSVSDRQVFVKMFCDILAKIIADYVNNVFEGVFNKALFQEKMKQHFPNGQIDFSKIKMAISLSSKPSPNGGVFTEAPVVYFVAPDGFRISLNDLKINRDTPISVVGASAAAVAAAPNAPAGTPAAAPGTAPIAGPQAGPEAASAKLTPEQFALRDTELVPDEATYEKRLSSLKNSVFMSLIISWAKLDQKITDDPQYNGLTEMQKIAMGKSGWRILAALCQCEGYEKDWGGLTSGLGPEWGDRANQLRDKIAPLAVGAGLAGKWLTEAVAGNPLKVPQQFDTDFVVASQGWDGIVVKLGEGQKVTFGTEFNGVYDQNEGLAEPTSVGSKKELVGPGTYLLRGTIPAKTKIDAGAILSNKNSEKVAAADFAKTEKVDKDSVYLDADFKFAENKKKSVKITVPKSGRVDFGRAIKVKNENGVERLPADTFLQEGVYIISDVDIPKWTVLRKGVTLEWTDAEPLPASAQAAPVATQAPAVATAAPSITVTNPEPGIKVTQTVTTTDDEPVQAS